MWYLAVALSLLSVAIPLQLEKEWITIGLALNGLAIIALWVRLDHPGLKYFGLALLAAATVRLVANPAVLSYHIRAAAPVLNWLTYTYLVPASALVLVSPILEGEGGRPARRLGTSGCYPAHRAIGGGVVRPRRGGGGVRVDQSRHRGHLRNRTEPRAQPSNGCPPATPTTSVAWAVYALVLLAIGVRSRSSSMRWLSLGLLVLTLGKVFLHDLGELEDLYRVGSLVGLAASLIIVSLVYQRFVFRTVPGQEA